VGLLNLAPCTRTRKAQEKGCNGRWPVEVWLLIELVSACDTFPFRGVEIKMCWIWDGTVRGICDFVVWTEGRRVGRDEAVVETARVPR
jgi:hypothetical protein